MLGGILPAVGLLIIPAAHAAAFTDKNHNGIEDVLDDFAAGRLQWAELRQVALPHRAALAVPDKSLPAGKPRPAEGPLAAGRLRVLCLDADAGMLAAARASGRTRGRCDVVHDGARFGGFAVLDVDAPGLRGFLAARPGARVMVDRDGVPALVDSRSLLGVGRVTSGDLDLGNDWSGTIAILDSGVDTAHGDLGDPTDDDVDGPAPAVGDAADWFDGAAGWPLFQGYKVVGWHDVTDDFPGAAGPWDYNYHGTALASVAAGSGAVDPDLRGVAAGARLTVVKYYDFDGVWRAWAGDFLAACAWLLDNHETYRVRTVLTAVNWDTDAGISDAMAALVDAGLLPIAAMGNYGEDPAGPGYPAVLPDVLTVGAVNANGAVSAFSGRGLPGQDKPDLMAPGGGLLVGAGRIMAADNEPDDSYSERYGTSLAAAHVAGAAYLVDEALREHGMELPASRAATRARQHVLRMTAAHIGLAAGLDGTGTEALGPFDGHDPARGWGLVRVDAAVHALLDPLPPGVDAADTLSSDWRKPVVARRLGASPGVRYLVEVVPSGSLDVCLEIVEIDAVSGDLLGTTAVLDQNGAGVSEFTYHRPAEGSWSFVVARRLQGGGSVVLRLQEADTFSAQGGGRQLPGLGTGAPNVAYLAPHPGPSLVIPSRVLVDPSARSVNVTDAAGVFRPGWPVFVFPAGSAQGGLHQPMVMDLDAIPGEEIVVSSEFGSIYFFDGAGTVQTVELAFNEDLSPAVGFRNGVGSARVLVVDHEGVARTWSWNASVGAAPEMRVELALGHNDPLAPAAGHLVEGTGETVVIAFADGWLGAFDANLALLPGWPRDLGANLATPPVLCDLDGDDRHEVVVPVLDTATGTLVLRVLDGDGTPLPGDGSPLPPAGGGRWLAISDPAVAGRYGTGELNVAVVGLADNGQAGADAAWSLDAARYFPGGLLVADDLAVFRATSSTGEGELKLDGLVLGPPVAWNQTGGYGTELAVPFHVRWNELLYGLTSIPGGTTGLLLDGAVADPLVGKLPLELGGALAPQVTHLGSMLVPLDDGTHLRVLVADDEVVITPVLAGAGQAGLWRAARADNRNTGAYPFKQVVASSPVTVSPAAALRAWPNPAAGRLGIRAAAGRLGPGARLEVFDLRGRLVHRAAAADGEGIFHWDGRDPSGRRLAAGTYLAVVREAGRRLVTRVVLTR